MVLGLPVSMEDPKGIRGKYNSTLLTAYSEASAVCYNVPLSKTRLGLSILVDCPWPDNER